jgi:hypothetical protein
MKIRRCVHSLVQILFLDIGMAVNVNDSDVFVVTEANGPRQE